ncbi:MAG: T9SS type A sorting domain-containing protein [candidate division Zixibacteria bacterium]|nr:T9SS type A sorting domain-containing protein [candidate division Zixibacteria bacterium]NIT53219.1 T9SS type A sorting domain-containing protein [candidate division Zixibacteria bacterium]NIW41453.1 T9SS type A sorting domain-containing protein [candidate division Zixibacteria bacterium]NIX55131.1 T9SS type A sorting domain-containing protein [candidate division Zixibacteria bacterium]
MKWNSIKSMAVAAILVLLLFGITNAQDDTAWVQLQYSPTDFQYSVNDTLVIEAWFKSTTDLGASSLGFVMNRFLFDVDTAYWTGNVTVTVPQMLWNQDTIKMGAIAFAPLVFFPASTEYVHVATAVLVYKADSVNAIIDSKQQFFIDSSYFPPGGDFILTTYTGFSLSPELVNDTIQLGISKVTDINPGVIPAKFELGQNYPNPFNPTTNIEFAVPARTHVRLNVYNITGQKVRTLIDQELEAGWKLVTWDGKSDSGNEVGSGMYLYRVEAGDFVESKKMMLVK